MSLLYSFTGAARGGLDQPAYAETLSPSAAAGIAAFPSANAVLLNKVRLSRPLTVSGATVFVGTASGNIDIGVYEEAGGTMTRIASTGSTAAAGANAAQTVAFTAPVTLQAGRDYWLALAADNTTVTFARSLSGNAALGPIGNQSLIRSSSFPLPASFATPTGGTTVVPFVRAA